MKNLTSFVAPIILVFIIPQISYAEKIIEKINTVSGELKIIQIDSRNLGNKFNVFLNDKNILSTNDEDDSSLFPGFPVPTILKNIEQQIYPYDQVLVFQQNMWANACIGGPIWFLGLKKDKSYSMSKYIDFCGGPDPILKIQNDKILIDIPGYQINNDDYIPGENWVYKNGVVSKVSGSK